ncbi:hypothetical protein E0485_12300 [Paenibacillus albiflavus]|uniref:F0F1-type ATP synthase n=1 Tax=Paenibacillus albiflavus TaxID=2545760 RepID=A0A4R4EG50_9BACL|nr:hypothetical protein [Paenibacillus albiflavus]TCZ77231.1 hypothetical protein E0485_12300 [Paenibacillus albiflavus]
MKITNLAIIFILIIFPFTYIQNSQLKSQQTAQQTEQLYDTYLSAAVQDAAAVLRFNEKQQYEATYESIKKLRANKEQAVEAFLRTLYTNFSITDDPVSQQVLAAYIPVILVIDYDGYYIYSAEEYKNVNQEPEVKHVWKPKKFYSYVDQAGNSLSFTLDTYVYAYDRVNKQWSKGFQADLAASTRIPLLKKPEEFDQIRRSTIVNSIQQDLAYYINQHNTYARHYGITYTFTLPLISEEEWTNTINDMGVIAFIQGIPIGAKYYNNYALGGSRLLKKPVIYGAIRDGVKIYYRSSCNYTDTIVETFTSEIDAAKKGYFPRSCINSTH